MPDFLLQRRTLLADEINKMLASLAGEPRLWVTSESEVIESRIDAIKHNLRTIIAHRLVDVRGDDAIELIPKRPKSNMEYHEGKHVAANPFEAEKYQSFDKKLELLLYSDLIKIVAENWRYFENDFGDLDKFQLETGRIIAARNGLKHNRELNRSEKAGAEASVIWIEDCLAKYENHESDDGEI